MIFQVLDAKTECKSLYVNNTIVQNMPAGLTGTWDFSHGLPSDIDYAKLYCGGLDMDEVCPEYLRGDWKAISKKLKAYLSSFMHAKISLQEHCFYDMVPQHFLLEFYAIKNEITKHVFEKYEKPANYNFLLQLSEVVADIKSRPLKLKMGRLDHVSHQLATRNFIKRLKRARKNVEYNIFGTKTGRLTTKPNSFPILTLKREYRCIMEPNNDFYIELDFNAAELRTLLSLVGKKQPKEDIHAWNVKNVFRGIPSRSEAKERIFAWLYNPDSKDYLANRAYDKGKIKEKYWDGKIVTTPFGRRIEADEFHALNYLIQSTTADMVLRQMIKVHKILSGLKSYIAFSLHDSLVIDFAKEDKHILNEVFGAFSKTDLGEFVISISAGKNFGNLKKIK